MRLKLGAVLGDGPSLGEAEDLKAAAVSQQRTVPADKPVETSPSRDQLVAGTEIEVIGIAEDDLGAAVGDVAVQGGFDGSLRADGHERRRVHEAVRGLELTDSRGAIGRA